MLTLNDRAMAQFARLRADFERQRRHPADSTEKISPCHARPLAKNDAS
jgi:hypothetical protein